MTTHHLCVVRGVLFRYDGKTGKYDELGEVGCTIVGASEADQATYKLGCYNEQNEYVCTATIGPSNEAGANVALQGNYVSFRDEAGTTWSLQFDSEEEAVTFCGSVAVAMYGAAGQPQDSILVCDVDRGVAAKIALPGSLAKVRFTAWVLQSDPKHRVPTLGSQLDGTDTKPLTVNVPANHLCVDSDMKGFEGLLVGMHERACRFVVVPKALQRGAGPKVSMCFFVEVVGVRSAAPGDGTEKSGSAGALTIAPARPSLPHTTAHTTQHRPAQPLTSDLAVTRYSGPAGFDKDQFLLVDRLRDQVFTLTEQLREARQQLQAFSADVRSYEQRRKPKSLLNAQIEYSVHKLLSDVEEQRERLTQREETLARMEEKNTQLQRTLERLQQSSNLLHEENKSSATAADEEKLELDRQILQAQTHLNRLLTEVEDTVRNVDVVKRLLHQTESDIKAGKQELQVSLVSFQTNESRLATTKDSLREETERCTMLESKVGLLSTELQTLQDDIQMKNNVIEECRRKTESDVLHYEQLLEVERQKASDELRGMRQELLTELSARDRRYQEERQRAAQEAYDRGRSQGVDEGATEAMLVADMKARELTLALQRHTAETKAMESRIRVAKEERTVDERRLGAEMEVAEEKLSEERRQIAALEKEIESLTQKYNSVTDKVFEAVERYIEAAKGKHISQRMLLRIIAAVQAGETDADFSFQAREEMEDNRQKQQEQVEVEAWVRAVVYNQPASMPPLRPGSAVVDNVVGVLGGERTVIDDSDDQFLKIGDILRIREPIRKHPPPPTSAALFPHPVSQTNPSPQQVVAAPPPPPPPPPPPQTPQTQSPQLLFVARNPFQQPSQLPPQPQAVAGPGGPAPIVNPSHGPQVQSPPTYAPLSPQTQQQPSPAVTAPLHAAFPPPHPPPPSVGLLHDCGPPPSLNDNS